jgi:hypothetical protein
MHTTHVSGIGVHNPQPQNVRHGDLPDGSMYLSVDPVSFYVGADTDPATLLQQARTMRAIATHAACIADALTARVVAVSPLLDGGE